MLCIGVDDFVVDIPLGFFDEVGQKDDFDFVEEENLADCSQNLADRILRRIFTSFGDRNQEGHHHFYLRLGVVVQPFGVLGGSVTQLPLCSLFLHYMNNNLCSS